MYFLCCASCSQINQSISDMKFSNTMLDYVFIFKFLIAVLSTKMQVTGLYSLILCLIYERLFQTILNGGYKLSDVGI